MGDKVIMKIYSRFTVKPVGLDDCSSIDLTKYAYVIKFCDASGQQSILHEDAKSHFLKSGESKLHCFEYNGNKLELPLVRCDIYFEEIITDKIYSLIHFQTIMPLITGRSLIKNSVKA
ncbi:hypothetical protein FNN84_21770 [Salmonella enterica subsp. salamae]|uniref:Uncharacterized protein n=1 Tax=Salmonella enterica subsp. salamae TaxID=59202 RepID=A0A5Y2S6N2_SALER|nr:hypothetical protein [Salmonella enterica subsp. salamae]ECJ2314374.1 hypothetical protein [Salmonella enterica subsp. salamae]